MRIKFPFSVKQVDKHTVEVYYGDDGLPLPQVEIKNVQQLKKEYKLSDPAVDTMFQEANRSAVEALVRSTITIEE